MLVNRHAGAATGRGGRDDGDLVDRLVDRLGEELAGMELRACEPDELGDTARAALDEGVDLLAVAGGDGTVNAVAGQLADRDVPLLVVPVGTRNHFATALGLDSVDAAADAARAGIDRHVDLGAVGGRVFVNNASIGLYPRLVRRREAHRRRLSDGLGNVVAAWEQLRHGRRFDVDVDGVPHRAWAVFIGNGCYGASLGDLLERTALDAGVLDVRVVRAHGRWSRVRLVTALLTGQLTTTRLVERIVTTGVRIELDRPQVDVAVDGEVVALDAPLTVTSRPGALAVRVPR